ncbi:MAG TPA: hypothetical protein VGK93_13085 [Candidatus Eisenbacteria bacterium]|jgi:hypothetical protein
MERIDPTTYRVTRGERVEIEVASVDFDPPRAVANGYATVLEESRPSRDRIVWTFTVTRDPGKDHRVRLSFEYPPGTRASDHYHVRTSGNEGHGFDVADVYDTEGEEQIGLVYRVAAS